MAESATSDSLRRTPLFEEHVRLGARMTGFGGWEMPLTYAGQIEEHKAVRGGIGMFDVSHMGQVRFTGAGALAYLQHLVPGNIGALEDGKGRYTTLCTETGGVVDDLIICRVSEQEFFAVVNASTKDNDVAWMRKVAAEGQFIVTIADESDVWAMIAVQGPTALELLDRLVPGTKWSDTAPFTLHSFEHAGRPHLMSRTGYTGETGAELLCPPDLAHVWWRLLLDEGVVPCGLAARDSLRLEAGYCLYGQDLDLEHTPVEAGLNWTIGWRKEDRYLGREVLERQKAEGPPTKLIGLVVDSRRPPRHGDKVVKDGVEVGVVTSGGYSIMRECGIALAYVTADAAAGPELGIPKGSAVLKATVTRPPFVKTSLSK